MVRNVHRIRFITLVCNGCKKKYSAIVSFIPFFDVTSNTKIQKNQVLLLPLLLNIYTKSKHAHNFRCFLAYLNTT